MHGTCPVAGKCLFTIDWAHVLSYLTMPAAPRLAGRLGVAAAPGSDRVWLRPPPSQPPAEYFKELQSKNPKLNRPDAAIINGTANSTANGSTGGVTSGHRLLQQAAGNASAPNTTALAATLVSCNATGRCRGFNIATNATNATNASSPVNRVPLTAVAGFYLLQVRLLALDGRVYVLVFVRVCVHVFVRAHRTPHTASTEPKCLGWGNWGCVGLFGSLSGTPEPPYPCVCLIRRLHAAVCSHPVHQGEPRQMTARQSDAVYEVLHELAYGLLTPYEGLVKGCRTYGESAYGHFCCSDGGATHVLKLRPRPRSRPCRLRLRVPQHDMLHATPDAHWFVSPQLRRRSPQRQRQRHRKFDGRGGPSSGGLAGRMRHAASAGGGQCNMGCPRPGDAAQLRLPSGPG